MNADLFGLSVFGIGTPLLLGTIFFWAIGAFDKENWK